MGHQVEYFGMEDEGRVVSNRLDCYTGNMDFHTGKLQKLRYPFQILYSTEAAKKIRKVLDDLQPDVVHVNNFNFQLTPSILYAIRKYEKQTGRTVRIVYTAHDSQLVCPKPSDAKTVRQAVPGMPGTEAVELHETQVYPQFPREEPLGKRGSEDLSA